MYFKESKRLTTSCSSLKQSGYFKSGFYNIKEDNSKKVVFCDMTSDSYESYETVHNTGSPVGTILVWTMKVESNGTETKDIPDHGWMDRTHLISTITRGFSEEVNFKNFSREAEKVAQIVSKTSI